MTPRIEYMLLITSPVIPAAVVHPGDQCQIDHALHKVRIVRGTTVVGVYNATNWPGVSQGECPPVLPQDGVFHPIYGRVVPMPGINVSMTGVTENQTTGAVTLKYSNGTNSEYASWEDVGAVADQIDANSEYAEKLLAAKAFRSSPDGSNKTTQVGASVGVNVAANTPVVYEPAG